LLFIVLLLSNQLTLVELLIAQLPAMAELCESTLAFTSSWRADNLPNTVQYKRLNLG
jgi:hypothetical protein